jgi:nicotinamidase-related amidase
VIKPHGFFGGMLSEPIARSGVIERAARCHAAARAAGLPVFFTRFVIPEGEGELVRNTDFMRAVGDAQDAFRPGAPGAQLIPETCSDRAASTPYSLPGWQPTSRSSRPPGTVPTSDSRFTR